MGRTRDDSSESGELFARLYPELRRFAGVIRPVGMEADDLVQEAVARTLATRPLASVDNPLAYLRTAMVHIAANAARSTGRANRRNARTAEVESSVDPYPSDVGDLMRVPVRARAVLYVTVIDCASYRDAAAVVGCSEEAARALASRALRDLRGHVRSELGSEATS
jgi:RNA polymerase sigma-70 factor (ECF subfamily)